MSNMNNKISTIWNVNVSDKMVGTRVMTVLVNLGLHLYNHAELYFYINNGCQVEFPLTGIKGTVYPAVYGE